MSEGRGAWGVGLREGACDVGRNVWRLGRWGGAWMRMTKGYGCV